MFKAIKEFFFGKQAQETVTPVVDPVPYKVDAIVAPVVEAPAGAAAPAPVVAAPAPDVPAKKPAKKKADKANAPAKEVAADKAPAKKVRKPAAIKSDSKQTKPRKSKSAAPTQ